MKQTVRVQSATARNARRLEKKADERRKAKQFTMRCVQCRTVLQVGLSHGRTDEEIYDAPSSRQLRLLHERKTGCKGILPPPAKIPVNVFCESCDAVIHTEERNDALAYKAGWIPAETKDAIEFRDRAIAARQKHIAETGCDGGPDPLSPGRLDAAAPTEMEAVAELLGVSREEAARITSDTLGLAGPPTGITVTPARSIRADIAALDAAITVAAPPAAKPGDTLVDRETGSRTPLLGQPGMKEDGTPWTEADTAASLAATAAACECEWVPPGASTSEPLPPGAFNMDGMIHKAGDDACCLDIGRRCDCGGRVHMQGVQGGMAYQCERCGSDKPGARR